MRQPLWFPGPSKVNAAGEGDEASRVYAPVLFEFIGVLVLDVDVAKLNSLKKWNTIKLSGEIND